MQPTHRDIVSPTPTQQPTGTRRRTLSTLSFWATVYAMSQGVPLVKIHYRERANGKSRFCLDNTNWQASDALDAWFDKNPTVDSRGFIAAYYSLVEALHQAGEVAGEARTAQAPIEADEEAQA